jgi:hypothetical protein
MAPSKTFLTAVAPKGLVTPLVKIPFIQDVIVNLKPEEKRFYEFLSKLYLESLKIYGPPTLELIVNSKCLLHNSVSISLRSSKIDVFHLKHKL